MKDDKILIVGFSGAGKTYLLDQLKDSGETGDDLDRLIIDEAGFSTTREMIIKIGIEKFREIESKVLRNWMQNSPSKYLALGGGSITEQHLQLINNSLNLKCIYLDIEFQRCWSGLVKRGDSYLIELGYDKAEELFQARRLLFSRLIPVETFTHADDYLRCHN